MSSGILLPKNAQQVMINSQVGLLDTLILSPKDTPSGIAIIIHPDPKGGGTYTNKIVQTIAKVLNQKGYVCFCPNLRGVGGSSGEHDMGIGEIEDCLAVYNYAITQYSNLPVVLAGFSFGTAVASNAALQIEHKKLILVGPAVTRYNVVVPDKNKTLVIHGQEDEVISYDEVAKWAEEYDIPVSVFMKTGHFFHGKLIQLQNYLNQILAV
jgi:alpha/beta superfamily hydrolase